jgi:hypothetical protein
MITFNYVAGLYEAVSYGAYSNAFIEWSFDYRFDHWYNIVGTFDGTVASLYINGLQFSHYNVSQWNTLPGGFRIGSLENRASWWNGEIDDIRIYNRVLNWEEILQLCNEIP